MNARTDPQFPAVFIVGAPRTGSTILYQVLTNTLCVTYPDNLTEKFGRHLRAGLRASRLLFGGRPHDCFTSVRGRTNECGLHAPNEMERFFKRLFPQRGAACEVTAAAEVGAVLRGILTTWQQPVIFKSLRIGQRIDLILRAMPFARFIHVRRNPLYTAQSIILARAAEGKPPDTVWYVVPRREKLLAGLQGVRKVVHQVRLIDEEIAEDLDRSPGVGLTVSYEDLCRNVAAVTQRINAYLGGASTRPQHRQPDLVRSEKQIVDDATFHQLREVVEEVTWM